MKLRFKGLVAAPYTPFRTDGSLNLGIIDSYVDLLCENQVAAAFICGTTGEGLSLSLEERFRLADTWAQAAAGRLPVIVHVGHTSLPEARALSAHAAGVGATAIACMAPGFFKPASVTELVEWCRAVASAAPRTPFYYYHMPSMNGVTLPVARFLEAAASRIPTLNGIKYSYEDLDDFAACVRMADGRFDVLLGRDELLLDGLARGAVGAVGSTYNYAAPLYRRIIEARNAGDAVRAREMQGTAIRMIEICEKSGVGHLAASKSLMKLLGVDCGPVRLPLTGPTAAQIDAVHVKLEAVGFRDFGSRPLRAAA
jgi:N-acetylneuraminate lyase